MRIDRGLQQLVQGLACQRTGTDRGFSPTLTYRANWVRDGGGLLEV